MASEQAKRSAGKAATKIEVEKDKVPKMATHFEALAEKDAEAKTTAAAPSLEEISNMRATAQQNSTEAIRAAEERYHQQKAKDVASKLAAEKAAAAKDVALETGKGAAGYAGKVKDQAAVAGWGATQYTLEKVVDATKTVASVTSSVAGYTKDKVAGAGQTVGGYAGEKLAAAKDAVVATEEKAADYAARKKAEAQKSAAQYDQDEGGVSLGSKEQPAEADEEYFEGAEEGEETSSVFQAVGETIVEIGQTTKDLLVGKSPDQGK